MKQRQSCCVRPCVQLLIKKNIHFFSCSQRDLSFGLPSASLPSVREKQKKKKKTIFFFFFYYFKIKKFELAIFGHRFGI